MNDDLQHLRYLAIGHYIGAAIMALFACLPLIYLSVGLIFLVNLPTMPDGDPFPRQFFGLMFALIGGMAVLGWTFAALIFVAGRSLAARKRYTFCFVMAALCCASFPLGTVLGVFTILVLTRPTVKVMFQRKEALGVSPVSVPRPGAWRDQTVAERRDV
jgi:hypothetical protein